MVKFSEFVEDDEKPIEGEKVSITNILNKEIVITKYKVRNSKYKDRCDKCATVQFYEESNERKRIFFTGSAVIIEQLEKYGEKIPFMTTVTKIDKYFTLT